nr:RNA-directed DNA polymerase, eukaryota [Tanacetum cinerariifolium]
MVVEAAFSIGCSIMQNQFKYLGVQVRECMSRSKEWDGVLKKMESIRNKFFNGADLEDNKMTWIAWDKVLASKEIDGLGVSSFHALNRALILKWVWRFVSQDGSLWFRVIKALHGVLISLHSIHKYSNWCLIVRELRVLKDKGFDFISHCIKRVGDINNTFFWSDNWKGDVPFRDAFPRLFALETDKNVRVVNKLVAGVVSSFRRPVRGGREQQQWLDLASILETVSLSSVGDRWTCNLFGDGSFWVTDVRNYIDAIFLPSSSEVTRWVKSVPIKINIFAWRARRDCLPARANLIHRGVNVDSLLCGGIWSGSSGVRFLIGICGSLLSVLSPKLKSLLEGVFNVAWWSIWVFRNRVVFYGSTPSRSLIFDDIVDNSFHWSFYRCNRVFSWEDWYKNPHLISL